LTRVVDASAATAWLANEPDSAEVATLIVAGQDLIAPDLIIPEIGNALWKKSRAGDFDVAKTAEAFQLLESAGVALIDSRHLVAEAVHLATRFAHPVYDCLYLVLAQKRGAELVTLDKRMAAAATAAGLRLWTPRRRRKAARL
jgi:predicted nucleic acid-binding protein